MESDAEHSGHAWTGADFLISDSDSSVDSTIEEVDSPVEEMDSLAEERAGLGPRRDRLRRKKVAEDDVKLRKAVPEAGFPLRKVNSHPVRVDPR
jgi:hypothetical protein